MIPARTLRQSLLIPSFDVKVEVGLSLQVDIVSIGEIDQKSHEKSIEHLCANCTFTPSIVKVPFSCEFYLET